MSILPSELTGSSVSSHNCLGVLNAPLRASTKSINSWQDMPDASLRDPADQPRADWLITGDKDLLALAGRYPIVAPVQFWMRHGH